MAPGREEEDAAAATKVPLLDHYHHHHHHHHHHGLGGDTTTTTTKAVEEAAAAAAAASENGSGRGAGGDDDDDSKSLGRRVWEENKKLWVVAGPSIFTRFSTFGVTVISQAFIGHIGATELAAYALVSTVLMRFSSGILAQSKNMIITYLAMLNLALHVGLSWLLVIKLQMGIPGVMGSMVIAMWIPVFGQLAFVFFGGCPGTWTGFSLAAFADLAAIVKLSLSSGVMLCLELWYNTILVLLTGYMKNAEVALDALSICLNINGWEMMISIGFLAATGVRVANELGAGSARRAKFAIKNVVVTSFLIGFVLFVLFLFFRGSLAYIFTNDDAVAFAVADLSPLLAFSILLNSVQPVLSGVAVGAGWQSVVAYVNITSYYLIGIPLGAVLGYVLGLHVKGIWIGMLLGTLVQSIVLVFITLKTDWDKQVATAQERLKRWYMEENRRLQDSMGEH